MTVLSISPQFDIIRIQIFFLNVWAEQLKQSKAWAVGSQDYFYLVIGNFNNNHSDVKVFL